MTIALLIIDLTEPHRFDAATFTASDTPFPLSSPPLTPPRHGYAC